MARPFSTTHVDNVDEVILAATMNELADACNAAGETTIVNRATHQAITSGVLTSATWDYERQDDAGWFDPGTPDRITVIEDGAYVCSAQANWDDTFLNQNNNILFHHIERIRFADGIQEVLGAFQCFRPDQGPGGSCTVNVGMLAGDAFRLKVYQASGSTKQFGGKNRSSGNPIADSSNCEFGVTRIR